MKTTTETAEVVCWTQSEHDSRDTASGIESITVPRKDALKVARSIYGSGDPLGYSGSKNIASGHSVLIKYQSGRKRLVKSEN